MIPGHPELFVLFLKHVTVEQGCVQYRRGYVVLHRFLSTERVASLAAINIYVAARLATRSIVINLHSPK